MRDKIDARQFTKHDGLKDLLTGLLAFPAFLESAWREIKSAERSGDDINLFLLSLLENEESNQNSLAVRPDREISDRNEQELYELAARVLLLSNSITQIFRTNDLVARYTFADILIMTSGSYDEVSEKLKSRVEPLGVAVVGMKLRASYSISSHSSPQFLVEAISKLEQLLLTTVGEETRSE